METASVAGYTVVSGGKRIYDAKTGKRIHDANVIDYVKSLRIPPAYKDVVVNDPSSKSKVLAYGTDSKGRTQTIYHPEFIEKQRMKRFSKIEQLTPVFEYIQRHVHRRIRSFNPQTDVFTKDIMICLLIHLMLSCHFRIGSDKYLRDNGSYGLTTLEWRHIEIKPPSHVRITFIGKKGVVNSSIVKQPSVYKILTTFVSQRTEAGDITPTTRVFRYEKNGEWQNITCETVNRWMTQFNPDISSKDLRTWQANKLYETYIDRGITQKEALKLVATKLHHTPTVCKNNYIQPNLIEETSGESAASTKK